MIKKNKIELILLGFLILAFFVFTNVDIGFHKFFENKVFEGFKDYISHVYLSKFFVSITILGEAGWYFFVCIIILFLNFLFKKKIKQRSNKLYNNIKYKIIFLFFSLALAGIIAQILKHIFGRSRPNYISNENFFDFNFLTLNSELHSFPSGHATTIFVIFLVLSLFVPKLRYFFLFFASLVAFSRVVVGAHFFTDIVAGILVACISYRLSIFIFEKFEITKNIFAKSLSNFSSLILILIVFFITIIFVTLGSSLDIYISNFFYIGKQDFYLQSYDTMTVIVRKIFLPFLVLYLFVFPFLSLKFPIKKIYINFVFTLRHSLFISLSFLFNLLLVVNLLLKNSWGRARPNDILEFGGTDTFTAWFQISNACNSNCSFVSGDAATGFSLIALFFITKKQFFLWGSLFSGFIIGLIRMLEGGHFFSDVLIAGFIIILLNFLQYTFYKKKIFKPK